MIESSQYPFSALLIAGAPAQPGVYALWREQELIYLGRAQGGHATIRSRLVDHFSGLEGPCTQRATHYAWETCLRPADRELELLEEYRAQYRRAPRCNRL